MNTDARTADNLLEPILMVVGDTNVAHWTIGGTFLAIASWIGKRIYVSVKNEEPPTVRDWKKSQDGIKDSLNQVKSGLSSLEAILIEANLPAIRQTQMVQAAEINAIKAGQVETREELINLRRDCEEMSSKIDRQNRRIEELLRSRLDSR